MKTKNVIGVLTVAGMISYATIALAEDARRDADTVAAEANAASADAVSAQSIYELIQSGKIQMNERGELVVNKSVTDILAEQGRLDNKTAKHGIFCE